MMTILEDIWYTDQQKADDTSKRIVYKDKGILQYDISQNFLVYKGAKETLKIKEIISITRKRPKLNWKAYLWVSSIFLVYGAATNNLLYIIICLVPGILIGISVGWYSFIWTLIEYRNGDETKTAYFADGGYLGWAGIFGGNRMLFKKLNELAPTKPKAN